MSTTVTAASVLAALTLFMILSFATLGTQTAPSQPQAYAATSVQNGGCPLSVA